MQPIIRPKWNRKQINEKKRERENIFSQHWSCTFQLQTSVCLEKNLKMYNCDLNGQSTTFNQGLLISMEALAEVGK